MKYLLIVTLAGILLLYSVSVNAVLPENWHNIYPPGEGWRIICDVPGTNGSMIYFKAAEGEPRADDILVRIIYSHSKCWLYIAAYDEQCEGGSVTIDGELKFDLEGEGNYCVSACGRNFSTSEDNNKKYKTQSIVMFSKGKKMDITMNTGDGSTISTTIPLEEFAEVYSQLEAGTKCGLGDARH
jgi:hypothetical protein